MARYPDGVWLVDLAGISDPELVANEVAIILGLRGELPSVMDAIVESLRSRSVLIVLDDFERLFSACARLAERLVGAGPNVTVLATSREAMGVNGELRAIAVPPLPTPSAAEEGADLLAHDAVRLFADRAALSYAGLGGAAPGQRDHGGQHLPAA